MKERVLASLLALALTAVAPFSVKPRAAGPDPSANQIPTGYDETRDPQIDLDSALAEARQSGKRVLVFVGGDWCGWCHQMGTFFASNDDIRDLLHSGFVIIKATVTRQGKGRTEFLQQFPKITSFPFLIVLDGDGALLCMKDSAELENSEKGTYDPEKVCGFLTRWAPPPPAAKSSARKR